MHVRGMRRQLSVVDDAEAAAVDAVQELLHQPGDLARGIAVLQRERALERAGVGVEIEASARVGGTREELVELSTRGGEVIAAVHDDRARDPHAEVLTQLREADLVMQLRERLERRGEQL